jgi:bifunctional UDP-N-acetylglucosamine pyrophosphorylase/glucosamine-1-phosphate N-acetyltransferase
MAGPALEAFEGTLLVVCGDTPLLRAVTLHDLLEGHARSGASVTVLSMRVPDPTGYGRILRGAGGDIEGIVEERDATPAQRALDEVNSGIYAFRYPDLVAVLSRLTAHNVQGEYYLTDTVMLLRNGGRRAAVVCAPDARELLGINTLEQLAEAERTYHALGAHSSRPGGSG